VHKVIYFSSLNTRIFPVSLLIPKPDKPEPKKGVFLRYSVCTESEMDNFQQINFDRKKNLKKNPDENLFSPDENLFSPNENLFSPNENLFSPNENLFSP
jgi:hypothetical protein